MDVREHYNARKQQAPEERKESVIIGLRKFNNWVKAVLINRCVVNENSYILDMACGKGGDLLKYIKTGKVAKYVGIDIADVSVEQAKLRYAEMGRPFQSGEFMAGDAFSEPLHHLDGFKFDLVSCQFALHYAFKSEATAKQALENISNALKPNGLFICTIPNADQILKLPKNKHLKITMADDTDETNNSNVYGREYTFWLSDAIDSCPEYLVLKENFISLAKEHNLTLKEHWPFEKFYIKYGWEYHDLLKGMGVVTGYKHDRLKMTREEMQIAALYDAYIFRKV